MNAIEHYREAEKILSDAFALVNEATPNTIAEAVGAQRDAAAIAQVHATLAQVAVTVETAGNAAALLHSWDETNPDAAPQPVKYGGPWGKVLYPEGGAES